MVPRLAYSLLLGITIRLSLMSLKNNSKHILHEKILHLILFVHVSLIVDNDSRPISLNCSYQALLYCTNVFH